MAEPPTEIHHQHPKEADALDDVFTIPAHWDIENLKCHILESKCERSSKANPDACCADVKGEKLCTFCVYQRDLKELPQWPEMIFANNFLQLTHLPSGAVLRFDALEALKGVDPKKDWVKVEASKEWLEGRKDVAFIGNTINPFDWTFSTNYAGTLSGVQSVEPTDFRIDMDKLRVHEKILFYEEMTLFEDELADHGCACLSLKIRAMPSGWFILLRFYLRVDHVLIRVIDTRLRWDIETPLQMIREQSCRQAKVSQLDGDQKVVFFDPSALEGLLPAMDLISERFEMVSLASGR